MIYFIQEEDGSDHFVKIGWTDDLECKYDLNGLKTRMHNLQTGNARFLKILAIVKGTLADERMVQDKFDVARIPTKGRGERNTERGEWFRPVKELMDLISALPPYPDDACLSDGASDLLAQIAMLPSYKDPNRLSPEEQYRQMRLAAESFPVRPFRSTQN